MFLKKNISFNIHNIANVLCMPRFMTCWPSMLMISSATLLRLRSKQLMMYCHFSGVKTSYVYCLSKGQQKRGVQNKHSNSSSTHIKNNYTRKYHLFEYLISAMKLLMSWTTVPKDICTCRIGKYWLSIVEVQHSKYSLYREKFRK